MNYHYGTSIDMYNVDIYCIFIAGFFCARVLFLMKSFDHSIQVAIFPFHFTPWYVPLLFDMSLLFSVSTLYWEQGFQNNGKRWVGG